MFDKSKLAAILKEEGLIKTAALKKGELYLFEKGGRYVKWSRNGPPKYVRRNPTSQWSSRFPAATYSRKSLVVEYLEPFKWEGKVKDMAMADFREHWEEEHQMWKPELGQYDMAEIQLLRKDPAAWPVDLRYGNVVGRSWSDNFSKERLLEMWAENLGFNPNFGGLARWLEENDPNWTIQMDLDNFSLQNPARGNKPMEAWLRKSGEERLKELEGELSSQLQEYETRQSGTWVDDKAQESWEKVVSDANKWGKKLAYFKVVGEASPYLNSMVELKGRPWVMVSEIEEVRPLPWEGKEERPVISMGDPKFPKNVPSFGSAGYDVTVPPGSYVYKLNTQAGWVSDSGKTRRLYEAKLLKTKKTSWGGSGDGYLVKGDLGKGEGTYLVDPA